MSGRSRSYKDGLYKRLQNNQDALLYIQAALEDSQESFLAALKNVLEARNLSEAARQCDLDRANIYRMLGANGNPTLTSLEKILHFLGLRLAVTFEKAPTVVQIDASEDRRMFWSHELGRKKEHVTYQSVTYQNEFSTETPVRIRSSQVSSIPSRYAQDTECEIYEMAS